MSRADTIHFSSSKVKMETPVEKEEEMTEESWEVTVWRVKHIAKTNGDLRKRSGRIFLCRDDEEKYEPAIAEAIINDDLQKFLEITKDNYFIDEGVLLTYCIYRRAKKCAMALLSDDLRLYKHQRDEFSDDHVNLAVQHFCDPDVVEAILKQTAMMADICADGLLPIHIALTNLRNLKHVAHWRYGDSIFKLIILLCLPESKNILDCVRLLAERMKGVEDLAFYCVMDRGLIELATLLLVTREKVMAPMSGDLERCPEDWYSSKDEYDDRREITAELKLDGKYVYDELPIGHTIVHRLLLEHGLLAGEGTTLEKTADKDPELYRFCEESQQVLWDAYQLILIFQRTGEALGAYVRADHSSLSLEQIIKEVAVVLMEAGYRLTCRDIDLKDTFSSSLDVGLIWEQLESMEVISSKEETKNPEGWISLPAKFSMPNGSLSQVYYNRKLLLKESPSFMWNSCPCGMTSGAFGLRRKFHTSRITSANCEFDFLGTKEASLKKFAKSIELPVPKISLSKQLVFLASVLKKGRSLHLRL